MEIKKALKIVKRQQQWRRDEGEFQEEWIDDVPVLHKMPYVIFSRQWISLPLTAFFYGIKM